MYVCEKTQNETGKQDGQTYTNFLFKAFKML